MKCLILLSVVFACLLLVSCSLPRHQGPKSDHFDGKTFFNPQKSAHKGFFQLLKWQLFGVKKPWPKWVEFTPSPFTDFLAHREDQIRVTWINHASVLIEHQNLKILTDPVFSQRVSPFSWVGPQRVKVPGVELKNLPKVDVILISHNHYDHLDIESLKKINQRDFPKIFAPLGDCKVISQIKDVECIEVDWSEKKKLNDLVEITFTPSRHWSARGMFDRNKSLWGAFVIQVGLKKIYFAGDTGYGDHFKKAFQEFGSFDLALLPIGAYEPRWFMKDHHMNPEEAVQAHIDLRAKKSLAIHFGTFRLTDESYEDPVLDLDKALIKTNIPNEEFKVLEHGQSILF